MWSDLRFLAASPHTRNRPWTVLGDFNQTLYPSEHSSADRYSSPLGMRELAKCVTSSELSDIPCIGNPFTWSNKQGDTLISKNLDRIMINDCWLDSFPNALGVFGDPGVSDHSPCCIYLDSKKEKVKNLLSFSVCLTRIPTFTA